MPNRSGKNMTLTVAGTSVVTRTRISHRATHRLADVTDMGDYLGNSARTIDDWDVECETAYKNQSDRAITMTLGAYSGAELQGVTITADNAPVETADLADWISQRVPGAGSWRVRAQSRYASTQHFMSSVKTAATNNVSLAFTVVDADGSTVLGGTGRVALGAMDGAVNAAMNQEVEVAVLSINAVAASARMLRWAKVAASALTSQVLLLKNPAAVTQLSGVGYCQGATWTAPGHGSIRETGRWSVHTVNSVA